MKEIELTIKARNNRLKGRRLALHMTIKQLAKAAGVNHHLYQGLEVLRYSPRVAFGPCRVPGCKGKARASNLYVCEACTEVYSRDPEGWPLEVWPLKPKVWRPAVLKLAKFHHCEPSELFPEGVLQIHNNKTTVMVDTQDMRAMLATVQLEPPQSLLAAATPPDILLEEKETREELNGIMEVLTDPQQRLVRDMFVNDLSAYEIAEKEKLTRTGIDQRLARIMSKLRHPNQTKRLKDALGIGNQLTRAERQRLEEQAKEKAAQDAKRAETQKQAAEFWEAQRLANEARKKQEREQYEKVTLAAFKRDTNAQELAEVAVNMSWRYKETQDGLYRYRQALEKLGKKHGLSVEQVISLVKLKLHICMHAGCRKLLGKDEGGFCQMHLPKDG